MVNGSDLTEEFSIIMLTLLHTCRCPLLCKYNADFEDMVMSVKVTVLAHETEIKDIV